MSSFSLSAYKAPQSLVKRKLDVLTKDPEEIEPLKEIDSTKSKRLKYSVLGLLASLAAKRISVTDIKFFLNRPQTGGSHADVELATLVRTNHVGEGPRRVAVKKLRFIVPRDSTEERLLHRFLNEVNLLDKLSHPHIVEFIGFVEDADNRIAWLIFPWEENGNLRQFLRSGTWEIPERLSLIRDVVLGVEYLHAMHPPIRHGDLKSLNILVNSSNRAVITDFGSARRIREVQDPRANAVSYPATALSHVSREETETPKFNVGVSNMTLTLSGPAWSFRWAPPEALKGTSLSLASDIWALGWIAWEAITDSYPFEELDSEMDVTFRILEGQLPLIYDHRQLSQVHSLCSIMKNCWNSEPDERPSVTECWRNLQWMPFTIPMSKSGENPGLRSAALMLQIGEIHRLHNRQEEALQMYKQGLTIALSTEDQTSAAHLLVQSAEIHRERSQYDEAEADYSRALAIYTSIGNEWGQANTSLGLGHIQRARSSYAEAEASYNKALVLSTNVGDDLGRANAFDGLGDVQRERSNYVEAEASYNQALLAYKSIGYDLGPANVMLGLGLVHRVRHNYPEAEALYTQALEIYKSIGDNLGCANALDGLGDVQRELSNYVEAEALYTQALSIQKNIGYDLGRANSSLELAKIYIHQARTAEAKALIHDAARISEQIGYSWAKDTSEKLQEEVSGAERLSTELLS